MAVNGTKEAIVDSLLENARHWRGLRDYVCDINMPLLLNSDESPLSCRETPAEFEAINSSFSSHIHALFEALHDFESLSKSEDGDEFIRKDGLVSIFGRAVQELHERMPASLTTARLWFWKPSAFYADEDQSIEMPDLVRPNDADPLSLGLRTVASHLEQFDLRAFFTPDLFRAPVMWPRMKRLRAEFHPWCPDGTWYFVGPRGENPHPDRGFEITRKQHYPSVAPNDLDDEMDEEYAEDEGSEEEAERRTDMFRTEPLRTKIEPLLLAFADALKVMPALEEAE
ncbi:hypothetical protein Hte_001837 [Hypoxylon texense]